MTLSIMQSIVKLNVQLCLVSFMMSVIYKPCMLSDVMLNVVMLSVIMLNVVALFKTKILVEGR